MMYSVRLFSVFLLSLQLIVSHTGRAQFLATAKAFTRTTHQVVSPQAVQLREVLNQFKVRYQVDILFEDRLVSDHLVNSASVDPAASLENNLTKVLKPKGLRFTKVKPGVYLVLADKKAVKQTSAVEVPILQPGIHCRYRPAGNEPDWPATGEDCEFYNGRSNTSAVGLPMEQPAAACPV